VLVKARRRLPLSQRRPSLTLGEQEYSLRCPRHPRRLFVGRFPAGRPGLSAAASGGIGWDMAHVEAGGGAEVHLRGGAARSDLVGSTDGGASNHFLFFLAPGGVIDAHPAGPWVTFRPAARSRATLTLDEAERRMDSRARAGAAAGGWLAKGLQQPPAVKAQPAAAPRRARGGGSESESEHVRRGGGSDEEASGSEGEGEKKAGRRRRAGGSGGGAAAGEEGAALEDWEHDQAMTDDDEAAGVGDQAEAGEEAPPQPPRALAEEAEGEAGALDEAGRMQRLLRAARRREGEEGEEAQADEEEDEEAFEDEDFVDPDQDTRLQRLFGEEPPPPPKRAPPPRPPAAAPPPPPPPAAAKRPRSPDVGKAAGAEAAAPAAKVPRVLDAETLAQLAAIEEDCGIAFAEFREALSHGGLTTTELAKRFKKNLRTETAKAAFKLLLKRFTRLDEQTKLLVLR